MNDGAILDLHRDLVSIPSPSGGEEKAAAFLAARLSTAGAEVRRIGRNVCAMAGSGPVLLLDSHIDTVPAGPGWSRPPLPAVVESGRVTGLGANDAKGPVAALVGAFLRLRREPPPLRIVLALVCDEETGGEGTETVMPWLAEQGLTPEAAIVGEPTNLDIAVAQKGLLILEIRAAGRPVHAAHARRLGAANAIRELCRDVLALESLGFPEDSLLGPVTVEPTVIAGGSERNRTPAEAAVTLDIRSNPREDHDVLIARVRAAVAGDVRVASRRLEPRAVDPSHPLVAAARRARPAARLFGSPTLSDWVHLGPVPAIKVGPGRSERSHAPDEFVLEEEILDGAHFYEATVRAYADLRRGSGTGAAFAGPEDGS